MEEGQTMRFSAYPVVGTALLGMTFMSSSALANSTNFSYSSLSISAVSVSPDDDIVVPQGGFTNRFVSYSSLTGANVSGSLQLENNLILGLSSGYLSDSKLGTEVEESSGSLSVGFATPISGATDFSASVNFIRSEVEVCNLTNCADDSEDGYGFGAGVRHWASNSVELNASASYADIGDFGDTTAFGLGGAFWFDDHSSIGLSLSTSSDATSTAIGYRYAF